LIVVCVPARDEEKTIAGVLIKARRHSDRLVVCDDGSSDMTPQIAEALGAEVIRNPSAGGYGAALRILFKRAAELNPDVMVTLDADGQHDADEIPKLVRPVLDAEADIVVGSRLLSERDDSLRAYRRAGIKAITSLTQATSGLELTDAQSGFRAYGRQALTKVVPVELGMGASAEILMRAAREKLRVKEVPVRITYRGVDTSSQNPVFHGLDVVSSILKSVSLRHPLLFYGTSGLATMILGLWYGYFTIASYAAQGKPITNVALLSMAIVSSGLLLAFMGVILFTLTSLVKESGH
jgi:glycosyltransferase involved in cell wall biosynthesis